MLFVHDTGGLIGLRWACDHPDAVGGLVITNTGFFPDHEWIEIAKTMQTPIQGEALVDSLSREAFGTFLEEASSSFDERALDEYWKAFSTPENRRGMLELYRSFDLDELKPYQARLAALGVPTLVLWGQADEYLPRRLRLAVRNGDSRARSSCCSRAFATSCSRTSRSAAPRRSIDIPSTGRCLTRVAKLIYSAIASLDGYVEDRRTAGRLRGGVDLHHVAGRPSIGDGPGLDRSEPLIVPSRRSSRTAASRIVASCRTTPSAGSRTPCATPARNGDTHCCTRPRRSATT